nr:hypothetical protein [Tanacetum cinerariifolium]
MTKSEQNRIKTVSVEEPDNVKVQSQSRKKKKRRNTDSRDRYWQILEVVFNQDKRQQLHETHSQIQQTEMAGLRETDRVRQSHIVETLRVMRDMRLEMGNMQAELLALRGQPRRAGQPGGDVKVPNHQDAPRDADSHI